MKTSISISNYKLAVYVSSSLKHGKLKVVKPFPFDETKFWTFTVYKHKIPSKLINVTGIRNLLQEWKIIKKFIKKHFQVIIEQVKLNNIFASQNLAKYNLSYNMERIQEVGRQEYGDDFIFYLEPDMHAGLHVKSRDKPTISLMCFGTGSACMFLTELHQLDLVKKMLEEFYVESNLKQISI